MNVERLRNVRPGPLQSEASAAVSQQGDSSRAGDADAGSLLTKSHLRRMLRLVNLSPAQERDVVLTVTGTQLLCRVGEVRRLAVCDMLKDHDTPFSRQDWGSTAFLIRKRKQDQRRIGLYPRIAKGRRP